MQYVELHARSAFSFLEGASHPDTLAAACAGLSLPAMALLDRNGVYGAPFFHHAMENKKLKGYVGAEVSAFETPGAATSYYPLLAAEQNGYQNLCRLITTTKLRAKKNTPTAASFAELEQHARGLICLTGDQDGPLAKALQTGGKEEARRLLERLKSIFGADNVYVELQRHFLADQESRNRAAIELAKEIHLPILATNGVLYAAETDREVLDAFTCIKNKCALEEAGRLLSANAERYLKTQEQMASLFSDLPEAIENTAALASRLEFTLEDLGYEFPKFPVPAGESMDSHLRKLAYEGAVKRYGTIGEEVQLQLNKELGLIAQLGLAGYFLIVHEIVKFCEGKNIFVQGRGSAANSVVCYSLCITIIDPIALKLLFERFLSEARGEWPDIDLDLPSGADREEVIQHVYGIYGARGACMTANIITYRPKLAAREMGKILGFDAKTLNQLSELLPAWEWQDSKDPAEVQFGRAGLDVRHPRIRHFISLCERVQDMPRHLGQHPGGMIVCQGLLDAVVPLEPATMKDRTVCQWDKEGAESMGLVKIDLLGLGALGAVRDSKELVRIHHHEEFDPAKLPEDPKVYQTIAKGDTVGMFQVESRAQMASLPRNNPETRKDLTAQVALIRPGPITGGMTNPYLRRRQGKEKVSVPHKLLEPILERTYGVLLYQEQAMRVAMECANFSPEKAEALRRALSHKRSKELMAEIEVELRAGMSQKGITGQAQDEIVQFITSFALFGFPESHAASFASIAYTTAYLKVYYPQVYTAAILNNQPMGFYSSATLVQDAKRHGVKFRSIDVTASDWHCTLEHEENEIVVRIGLCYIRGLKRPVAEKIVEERRLQPFRAISDLCRRVPSLEKPALRMLAGAGALNNVPGQGGSSLHRRDALWQVQKYGGWNRHPLLEGVIESDSASPLSAMSMEERMVADYHATSLTIGAHPMAHRRKEMLQLGIRPNCELIKIPDGTLAIAAGQVDSRQRPGTAKGIMFISLLDETGFANVVVMPDILREYWSTALGNRFLRVEGVIQNRDGIVHLLAKRIFPLRISAAEISSHDFH
ncbi:MAG TPA: error-prone DNA polymerase [Candidatus Angelobacter sp.]|nr:error-prone DNA polymerase [Candidatus Angelobacter sp.]